MRRRQRKTKPILERFLEKFKVNLKTGCWEWTAALAGAGYGILFTHKEDGKTRFVYAHRFSYEQFVGPIPKGMEPHHKCENKKCVNYTHMVAITHQENMLASDTIASRNAKKTHCQRGHPYSPKNTHITPNGFRTCRACWAINHKIYR